MGLMRKFNIRFFLLLTIILSVSYCIYSCNKSQKISSYNLKEHAIIEDKFLVSYDTVYLLNVLDSLHKISNQTQDTKVLIHYLNFIKQFYADKNYYQLYLNADTLTSYLLENKLETAYPNYYTDALYAKGDYFFSILKYEDALRYFYEAKKFNNSLKLGSCSYNKYNTKMLYFYYTKGEYINAIPFAKQIIKQEEECSSNNPIQISFEKIQSTLNALALCYEKLGMYDSSIYFYRKGISYIESQNDKDKITDKRKNLSLGIYYGNLGGSFLYNQQYDSALLYLNKSILINDNEGFDLIDVQTAYLKLAQLYLLKNKPAIARQILDKTKKIVTTPEYFVTSSTRSKWYLLNFNYYIRINNLEKAVEAYQLYYHIQDSINTTTNIINSFNVSKEVERIKEDNKSKEIEKSNEIKSIYIIVFSIALVSLTIIILLILRYNKQGKKRSRDTKLHNIQLQSTLEQLQISNKNYARVMKVMAHDLRSPFSGIIGITDLLLHDENISEQERNEMLELMQTSANNSLTMIGELLQSSSSFEQKEIVKQPLDLIVLLKQCTDLLKFKAAEKQQTIHFYSTTHSIQIKADSEKLWRLFSNLIANAIKFSDTKKTIYVYVEKFVSEVIVSVQDEGIGIPEKFKDKVFDMFTEAKRKGTAGEQPFGIGLSICKQIVEAHNGKIWFISNEPHGTTFYVALPLEQ